MQNFGSVRRIYLVPGWTGLQRPTLAKRDPLKHFHSSPEINGEIHSLWPVMDHEGEVVEPCATKRRGRKAALKFLQKS